jgi:hypothetical protein
MAKEYLCDSEFDCFSRSQPFIQLNPLSILSRAQGTDCPTRFSPMFKIHVPPSQLTSTYYDVCTVFVITTVKKI